MKKELLFLACAIVGSNGIVYGAANTEKAADAAYEQMVDGRIAVNYYNDYLQEIAADARHYLVDELTKAMERIDTFVANGKFDGGAPSFSSNWRNAKDVLKLPTRVPNWYAADDLKLFKDGIEQIRKDTGELLKICEELQKYFQYNGGWKEDKCQKYTAHKPRIQELLTNLKKTTDAVDKRALDMALVGEKLFWDQDRALGYFVKTMKADVDAVYALAALIKNPGLQKEGNTDAPKTLAEIEKLLATLKESMEKNATLGTPLLGEKLKAKKDKFYTLWLKQFITSVEEDVLPVLKKGVLKADTADRVHADNVGRHYDEFIVIYTNEGGVAIKYKRY